MEASMSTGARVTKSLSGYQPPDWHSRNSELVSTSRNLREKSLNLRKDAQLLRVETDKNTKWHNFDNNMRLNESIENTRKWKVSLDNLLNQVKDELSVLTQAKETCERACESKTMPYEIAKECLLLRENGQREFEFVNDNVEAMLNTEINQIDKMRSLMRTKNEDAWDQISVLESIRQRLELDIDDKDDAIRVDMEQLGLTKKSAGLSHKPNATKIPPGSVQPGAWNEFSAQNKKDAEIEMSKSQKLRTDIFHLIEQTSNDLRILTEATNFEFRKRFHEKKRAIEDMEYNIKTTEEEIECQENNIRELEQALNDKTNPLKLAETRLENRTGRLHNELCTDATLEGLVVEVDTLRNSIQKINNQLDDARETLTNLVSNLKGLQNDRDRKKRSLSLDQQCIGIRKRLKIHDDDVNSQTDKNLRLVGVLRNKTKFLENSYA